MSITVDGHAVVMSLSVRTEPGEGWTGEEYFGEFRDMESLSAAINERIAAGIPVGWELRVDFQDDMVLCPDPLA